ncbi:MAG TPA: hypothetical protein VG028_01905 [Terriglobia bacterium]|nr:hypothetical protein [Terriglobia bacterium]
MSQLYITLGRVSWALGLVTLLSGVVMKVIPAWGKRFDVSPHGIEILAGALFLCALASRDLGRTA